MTGSGVKVGKFSIRKKPFPVFFSFLKAQTLKAFRFAAYTVMSFAFCILFSEDSSRGNPAEDLTNRIKSRFTSVLRPFSIWQVA